MRSTVTAVAAPLAVIAVLVLAGWLWIASRRGNDRPAARPVPAPTPREKPRPPEGSPPAPGAQPSVIPPAPPASAPAPAPAPAQTPAVPQPPKDPWTLVFEDRFDRKEIGERWKVVSGKWDIVDGRLRGRPSGAWGAAEIVVAGIEAPDCVRVEYAGHLQGLDNPNYVCDLSVMLGVKPEDGASEYFFSFNGASDHGSYLERAGHLLIASKQADARPLANERCSVVAERGRDRLRLTVEGKVVLDCGDPRPGLTMTGGKGVALYTFGSVAHFESVKVCTAKAADLAPPPQLPVPVDEVF
jgi:hypothetical protein